MLADFSKTLTDEVVYVESSDDPDREKKLKLGRRLLQLAEERLLELKEKSKHEDK